MVTEEEKGKEYAIGIFRYSGWGCAHYYRVSIGKEEI